VSLLQDRLALGGRGQADGFDHLDLERLDDGFHERISEQTVEALLVVLCSTGQFGSLLWVIVSGYKGNAGPPDFPADQGSLPMFRIRSFTLARSLSLLALICSAGISQAQAAPRINRISVHGLRVGATTTIEINGSDLGSGTRVLLPVSIATERLLPNSTAQKVTIELTLPAGTPRGRVAFRVVNAHGISNPVYVGLDDLEELAFDPEIKKLPVALNGTLNGSDTLRTRFTGKKGQRVVLDLEARRFGSNIDPIVSLLDPRKVQVAWSQGQTALAGDARLSAVLPADGVYTIELHDALYRAGSPGDFRLKVGQLYYADLAFPLGAKQGSKTSVELIGNVPAGSALVAVPADASVGVRAVALPDLPGMTGTAPALLIDDSPEYVAGSIPAGPLEVPVALNGKLTKPRQEDRFELKVHAGEKLRFSVLANRAGSPLDGVLTIRDLKGALLATSDDAPDAVDPTLEFTVPAGVDRLRVGVRDLSGRHGPTFVYRLAVARAETPDFQLRIVDERLNLAGDAIGVIRVHAERRGFTGPIRLSIPGLPPALKLRNDTIPANATDVLLTLESTNGEPVHKVFEIVGTGQDDKLLLRRVALRPDAVLTREQPWLRAELACALTARANFRLEWTGGEPTIALGTHYGVHLNAIRPSGVNGAIRLTLVTSQIIPKTPPPQPKDDIAKAIRFEGMPSVMANQTSVNVALVIPGDLPTIPYDVAIRGELLASNGTTVLATTYTPARRLQATQPFAVEIADKEPVKARSGGGATGRISGKIIRNGGFDRPVQLALTGLPADLPSPSLTVPGDRTEFAFPVSFPYETKLGRLSGVKLVASGAIEGDRQIKSNEVPVALEIVAGEPPPPAPALYRVFEDEAGFPAVLREGSGQIALESADRYAGSAALKVTGEQRFRASMPGWNFTIAEKPGPGQFRYLRFAWRKQGGNNILLQLNASGKWGPTLGQKGPAFRYEAGPAANPFKVAAIKVDSRLPDDWVVVTRDLFADFGSFKLSGLAFTPGPGGYGLFDHVYLARTMDDLKGCTTPIKPEKPLVVFEDQKTFVANLNEGGGTGQIENTDRYSGTSSVKITPDQRFNERLPGLRVKIAENPGAGEYRFLRYAWKKKGGAMICLQLNHDGQWGPTAGMAGKFRYYAGAGPEPYGAALQVDAQLPADWVVVTRDLFADFGAFTLSGLALTPMDGEFALFDHIYLGRSVRDFELATPAVTSQPKAEKARATRTKPK
jgi:hypothetical protein